MADLETVRPQVSSSDTVTDLDFHETIKTRPRRFWRRVVDSFSPLWFTSSMGTGIIAIDLINIPYSTSWLRTLSMVVFVGNVTLFAALVLVGSLSILLNQSWKKLVAPHGQGLFLGTVPMAFATIIVMFTQVCVPDWGAASMDAAWALWIINEVMSFAIALGLLAGLVTQPISLASVKPTYVFPFITPIVSSGAGSVIIAGMTLPEHSARATASLSLAYLSLGMGLSFSLLVLGLYFARLLIHGLPPPSGRSSQLVPLGPLGQGAGTLVVLGRAAKQIGQSNDSVARETMMNIPINGIDGTMGMVLHAFGAMSALALFGLGIAWLAVAIVAVGTAIWPSRSNAETRDGPQLWADEREKLRFDASCWGFVFPMGVFAFGALQLGEVIGDGGIGGGTGIWGVVGTVLTCWLIVNWLVVVSCTLRSTWRKFTSRRASF